MVKVWSIVWQASAGYSDLTRASSGETGPLLSGQFYTSIPVRNTTES